MNEAASDAGRVFRSLDEIRFGWIVVLLLGAFVVRGLVRWLLPWLAERLPGRLRIRLLPLVPVLNLLVLFLALGLVARELLDLGEPERLLVLLGTGGVALGFAFKDYAASLIAGCVALFERPYREGDRVAVDGVYGEVVEIGLRALRLRTPDDSVVTVPQSRLWTSSVSNANDGAREQLCVADFYLHPEHDAERVLRRLLDVAWTSPYLLVRRPPVVTVREQPYATHYRLKAYPIDGRDEFAFVTDLTVRGKAALGALGARPSVAAIGLGTRAGASA